MNDEEQFLLQEYRASAAHRAERVTQLLHELDGERRRSSSAEKRAREAEAKIAQLERRLSQARRPVRQAAPQRPTLLRRLKRRVAGVMRSVGIR